MAATELWRRWLRPVAVGALTLVATGALASCGHEPSTATWVVAPDQRLARATTGFAVTVNRVGCSSGVQGKPGTPDIEYRTSQIRITFTISPRITSGTCQGMAGVPYRVELREPLGHRSLVDGECRPGRPARGTTDCLHEGVRFTPR